MTLRIFNIAYRFNSNSFSTYQFSVIEFSPHHETQLIVLLTKNSKHLFIDLDNNGEAERISDSSDSILLKEVLS